MGRPLSKQQMFGANDKNNIKVQFHNGTDSVRGYILEQTGSKRFKCIDENGNTAVCYLKDKASADLNPGEMSITFKYDDGTIQQATKITRHKATFLYGGSNRSMPWGFVTSTSDGRWQVEEAGSDASMTGASDFELDDSYNPALDYPVPGSGTFRSAATALNGVTFANKGTPYAPGGYVTTVANSRSGLRRTKYDGNFCATSGTTSDAWDYNFFSTATRIKAIADTSVSWGQQTDGAGTGEHNFSCEWLGYVQAPASGNFNLFAESDDHIGVWIGTAAINAPSDATKSLAANNKTLPAAASGTLGEAINLNSVTLVSGKWYPIRIWFSEFTGGCKAQFYMQGPTGTKYNGTNLAFAYNTATGGYNP